MKSSHLPKVIAPLLVLIAAVAIAGVMIRNKPEAQRSPDANPGVLVEVAQAIPDLHRLDVHAQGSVQAAREVVVQPQVGGRVVEVSPSLVPGGRLRAGEMLYRIESADYELTILSQEAALAEAEARLALEAGRRRVAEREWELFADEIDADQDPALALREPQLRQARAAIESAKARLAQAQLDLERTTVKAPFNCFVRSESIELGQTVGTQSQTAQLVGTDAFWVQASVEADQLRYVDVPGVNAAQGSAVTIRFDAGGRETARDGRVVRLLGDLDPVGRLARVLIEVRDPLGLARAERGGAASQATPLLIDSYVDVTIVGNRSEELFEIPRSWLRGGDQVWVAAVGHLDVRELEIAWRREDSVLASGGVALGESIIVSALATPVAGMKLRVVERPGTEPGFGSSSSEEQRALEIQGLASATAGGEGSR
jgi:RND family efflux transporter MFP subunit